MPRSTRSGDSLQGRPPPAPLLWPAIAIIAGVWLSETVGPITGATRIALLIAPFLILSILFLRHRRARAIELGFLLALTALPVAFLRHQAVTAQPPNHIASVLTDGEPVLTRLAGRIVTTPIERPPMVRNRFIPFNPPGRTQFVLAVETLRTTDPSISVTGHIRVSVDAVGLDLCLGQAVQLTGTLYAPGGPRNPGARDWARWYRYQGLAAGMRIEAAAHVVPLPEPVSWWPRVVRSLRTSARATLFEPYADIEAEETTRLLDVMVLGQRSAADRKLNEAFLRAGGMHFLAVSGFHVGVLAGAVWWLMRRVRDCGRRPTAITMIAVATAYAFVAEPNAPILRATVAVICLAIAQATGRPACLLNWLALAAGAILLVNPLELFRPGFQLSFVLVTSLVVVLPRRLPQPFTGTWTTAPPRDAQTWPQLVWLKFTRLIGGLLLVCIFCWLMAFPLVALHFGRLAPWGILGTLLITLPVMATIILSFITVLTGTLVPPLGTLFAFPLRWISDGLLWTVARFEHLPGAIVERNPAPAALVIVTYGALLTWTLLRHRRPPEPAVTRQARASRPLVSTRTLISSTVTTLLILAWLAWLVLPGAGPGPGTTLQVLSVGNGNTVLLTTPDRRAVVFDVGTHMNTDAGEVAADALRALGIRDLDAVLISHANFDHYSGLPTLLASVPTSRWAASPYFVPRGREEGPIDRLLAALPSGARHPDLLRSGDRFKLRDVTLDVLWPPDGLDRSWTSNNRSLVVRATVAGRRLLITGDIAQDAMAALLVMTRDGRLDLQADVLLAPHHGAVSAGITPEFYAAVQPQVVVISADRTRPRLAARLIAAIDPACRVISTGVSGAVIIRVLPDGQLEVETPYAPRPPAPPQSPAAGPTAA